MQNVLMDTATEIINYQTVLQNRQHHCPVEYITHSKMCKLIDDKEKYERENC